jgi:septum site-determining protein MinD
MIAVAGGKGGSGKTTVALGVARALARVGLDPLLVDCDPDMPDLHHAAGIDRTDGVDEVAAGASVRRASATSPTVPGVRLLTAGRRECLPKALRRAGEWHGPVLFDCPPGVGPDASLPVRIADRTLLVATDRQQSLGDAATTASAARNLGAEPLGLVLRRTGADCSGHWDGQTTVLAETPTVDDPLDNPRVTAAWRKISDAILRATGTDDGAGPRTRR